MIARTEFRAVPDEFTLRGRQIRGHAAVFNSLSLDLGGFREIIAPGAFSGVLKDDVRALINHDDNLVLARTKSGTLSVREDSIGLAVEINLADQSYARDLAISLERGDVSQFSFGFYVGRDRWATDQTGAAVRTVLEVSQLLDVSVVTYPAYPAAADATLRGRQMSTAEDWHRRQQMWLLAQAQ